MFNNNSKLTYGPGCEKASVIRDSLELLATKQGKVPIKCLSQKHNRRERVNFKPRPCRSRSRSYSITTRSRCRHLIILSRIQPAEHRRPAATLSSTYRGSLDPDHILYIFKVGPHARQKRLSLNPRLCSCVEFLNNLAGLGIHASEWTNYRSNAEYRKNTFTIRVFIPRTSARPVGMSLPEQLRLRSIACAVVDIPI